MADKKRGWFVGFFVGVWALINFTRRLVINIIFVIIVVAVLFNVFLSRRRERKAGGDLNPLVAVVPSSTAILELER